MRGVRAVTAPRPTVRLLTVDEVGAELRISRRSAYRLVANGRIRSIELDVTPDAVRKPLRVREDDLAAYIEQRREAS